MSTIGSGLKSAPRGIDTKWALLSMVALMLVLLGFQCYAVFFRFIPAAQSAFAGDPAGQVHAASIIRYMLQLPLPWIAASFAWPLGGVIGIYIKRRKRLG